MSSFYSSFKLLSFESFDVFINNPFGLIYYYLGNKSEGRNYIQTAKREYIKNGFEFNFYSTFPQTLLNELNIN